MTSPLKASQFLSTPSPYFSSRSSTLSSQYSELNPLQRSLSLGTRSRKEIGQFGRVFTTSGSVNRQFPDVFRFSLNNRRRLRIYLGNQFGGSNPNRRMVLDLLDDRTLRRVTNVTVNPARIDAITRTLNPGTYRIRVSTGSNNRGRYFLDMVRL
ncbi:MAG: hypothetical protein IGS38_04415 [Synechococcales cyanobacterium M58_A2018_015]|nr:hypothetical protein [Synechococcales cyanobacterium M58_A2018_015]